MYPTAEVRWFLAGPPPDEAYTWFKRIRGAIERQPTRTDRYLLLPDSEGLNVKLRQGRLEIKRRVDQEKAIQISERASGTLERWHKWSFELAESGSYRAGGSASVTSSWIAVRKERLLRTYQVCGGEDLVPLPAPEPAVEGCELEMTTVRVLGQTWWTLAFEAFGDESTLQTNLLLVARHVLTADDSPRLHAGGSHGYASWLSSVARTKGSRS